MKGLITACAALAVSGMMMAQPKLTANNIDAVLKAMTLEEKATWSCTGIPGAPWEWTG